MNSLIIPIFFIDTGFLIDTPTFVESIRTHFGLVLAIIGALYGLYLLYLGLPVLMKSPPDKSMGYTVVVVVAAIVVQLVLGSIVTMVGIGAVGAGALMGGRLGAAAGSSAPAASGIMELAKLESMKDVGATHPERGDANVCTYPREPRATCGG